MLPDDRLEIEGLAAILDEDSELPYLELVLRYGVRTFKAAILSADEGWTVNVRDESGRVVPGSGDIYADQAAAIVAASLIVVDTARWPAPARS